MASATPLIESSTRDRLLDAALVICQQQGLRGATTRAIAEAAQVNEVTLFRHFGSKEKLMGALVQRSVATQTKMLSDAEPLEHDLRADLQRFAERLDCLMMEHEPLIRALIGESRQHPEEARQVISEAGRPLRERVCVYLQEAQSAGLVRGELDVIVAVDCFTGILLSGMLRRTGGLQTLSYTREEFIATSVDLFVRGIMTWPSPGAHRR